MGRRALGLAALALLAALGPGPGCNVRPRVVAPAHESALRLDGEADAVLHFGAALGPEAKVAVRLLAGIDSDAPAIHDVTALFLPQGAAGFAGLTQAQALLGPGDGIAEGRNTLFLRVDRDGDDVPDVVVSSTFSWEPQLDPALAERCDLTGVGACLFPFPNDHFTVEDPGTDTGRRVSLVRASMPDNASDTPIDPTEWNRNDGFSPGPMILAQVPGLDLARSGAPGITDLRRSLEPDSPILILDAVTGEPQLFWAELDSQAPAGEPPTLFLRVGRNLASGGRYVVVLRNLLDASGDAIPPSRGFRVYRDRIATYLDPIEARRPTMEDLFDRLEGMGVAREELHLAWEFTVISKRNLSERMIAMRDDAFQKLGVASPAFQITAVEELRNDRVLRRVDGTFTVPRYIDNDGLPGARLVYGADGLPEQVGTYEASFRCTVPRSTTAGGDGTGAVDPARVSLYGHGLLGSGREAGASHVETFAQEHNIVFCGTDWIGMAEDDADFDNPPPWVGRIILDLSRFPTLPDRMHQGFLNFLFLGRLLTHPDGFASHPAFQSSDTFMPLLDGSDLFYDGNSQGAIAGGALAAFAQDYTQTVLGVPGMNYSTLLRRSVDFDTFLLLFTTAYDEGSELAVALSLIQMLWDRTETNGHANHLTRDPYPGTPPKEVLLHVAFGDFQVANVTAEVEARTLGAHVHQPALAPGKHWEAEPFFGIPPLVYPHDGSALVYWDSGNLTPPNGNVPPRTPGPNLTACPLEFDGDPHECPRRQAAARRQKSEFMRTPDPGTTAGMVIEVCADPPDAEPDPANPVPCLAPSL